MSIREKLENIITDRLTFISTVLEDENGVEGTIAVYYDQPHEFSVRMGKIRSALSRLGLEVKKTSRAKKAGGVATFVRVVCFGSRKNSKSKIQNL